MDIEHHRRPVAGFDLHPVAIISAGCSGEPAERLIGLQSLVGKLIDLLAFGFPRRAPESDAQRITRLAHR
jgi:hypothetical protein